MTTASEPRLRAPPGACDCHMHIYDPRFLAAPSWPLVLPNAPLATYRAVQAELGLSRAVIVQPNGYMFDNACTEEAVRGLGSSARGIATIRPDIAEVELERLTRAGFRGARCFMLTGGGKFLEPVPTTHPAFAVLRKLLDSGKCWVKLSAPYETSKSGPPGYTDVSALARALAAANPERCVWATNWPHPGMNPIPSTVAILVDNPARLYGF